MLIGEEPLPLDTPDLKVAEDKKVLCVAVNFAFECASRYAWTHLPFSYNLPSLWAVYLHADSEKRRIEVMRLRRVVESVHSAELKFVEWSAENPRTGQPRKAKKLLEILNAIGWSQTQLGRDCMSWAFATGFDSNNLFCRRMAAKFFRATSATKHCLEDAFAHLQRVLSLTATNKRMGDFTKYFYLSTFQTEGSRHIRPSSSDWETVWPGWQNVSRSLGAAFDTNLSSMPEPGPDDDDILKPQADGMYKKKRKAAGPASNQKGAAGAAYIMYDVRNDFQNLEKCWAGQVIF